MSSSVVFSHGRASVILAANESIAVYSKSACQVSRRFTFPQFPPQDTVLGAVADAQTVFGPYTAGATIVISPGASNALYEVGLSPNVIEVTSNWTTNAAPGTLNATGTLTGALIQGRIVTSTTVAAVTATLDTGTVMDTLGDFAIGDEFIWSVINTGGANAFTVTAAAGGHTLVGVGAVAATTSATFLTRKTAANTFVTYRTAG